MPEASTKPLLLLVDGHSLAFRSFYAFSKGGEGGLATKDGRPTSVTYGFLKSLLDTGKSLKIRNCLWSIFMTQFQHIFQASKLGQNQPQVTTGRN